MTKKPWGEDYVPDDRPWTFPPNALLPTEEVKRAINEATNGILAPRELHDAAIAAIRALAKPDEGVVERVRGTLNATIRQAERYKVAGQDEPVVGVAISDLRALLSSLSDNAGVR